MGTTATAVDIEIDANPYTRTIAVDRRIEFNWKVATVPCDDSTTRSADVVGRLSVWHSKDRRSFVATFTALLRYPSSTGFTVETYEPFADVITLGRSPVGRYSLKALTEFSEEFLTVFLGTPALLDEAVTRLTQKINDNGGL